MLKGIIGKKLGMTQIFHEDGGVFPVTVVLQAIEFYKDALRGFRSSVTHSF